MEYRNRRKSWSWALGLTTLICVLLVGCLGLATAESQLSPLTLTLVDDNKTVTSTVTTSGSADISWEKDSTRSKSYQLTIDAQLPAGVIHPQLIISLAEGMRFENDAADLSERVTLMGSQPNTVPAGYADANTGNDFKNTGTRTYDSGKHYDFYGNHFHRAARVVSFCQYQQRHQCYADLSAEWTDCHQDGHDACKQYQPDQWRRSESTDGCD